jgi:hypothetical protein
MGTPETSLQNCNKMGGYYNVLSNKCSLGIGFANENTWSPKTEYRFGPATQTTIADSNKMVIYGKFRNSTTSCKSLGGYTYASGGCGFELIKNPNV